MHVPLFLDFVQSAAQKSSGQSIMTAETQDFVAQFEGGRKIKQNWI